MKKGLKTTLIVIAVILVVLFPLIGSYNGMVSKEQRVNQAASNIDTNLQRRSDLISNLVETVKGYAAQEKDIFKGVADARSKLAGAQSMDQKANANEELSSAVSRLLVVVERYPELKSSQNFKDLSIALEGTENRIAIARQDYNKEVTSYNTKIKRFPASIIANMFRFQEKPYFKAEAEASKVPKVDFSK